MQRSSLPVVVVGNLSVGGTGKTPLCTYLVKYFEQAGWRPGIVSRGYGGERHATAHLITPSDKPAFVGDEPLMLFEQTGVPVCVCITRALAVEYLAKHTDVDIVFSDDGLQHLAMSRVAEVVVIDGKRGFGNGWMLPAGPLREPVNRLAHADLLAVQTSDRLHASLTAMAPPPTIEDPVKAVELATTVDASPMSASDWWDNSFTLTLSHVISMQTGQQIPLADFIDRPVIAMAGIGHPERFFDALRACGLQVQSEARPDHHVFTLDDFSAETSRPILVTSKDAVKLKVLGSLPADVYEVPAVTRVSEALHQQIVGLERQMRSQPSAKLP